MSCDAIPKYQYTETEPVIVQTPKAVDSFFKSKRDIYEPDADETILIFVRHGQNLSNVAQLFGGSTLDWPLTPLGKDQSLDAGVKISKKVKRIDHIITPTMGRTHETAREILKAFPNSNPEHVQDARLEERDVGIYEGLPLTEIKHLNVKDRKRSSSKTHSFENKMKYTPHKKEIESYAEVWERAHQCLQETCVKFKGKVVLTVLDSGTFRAIYWHLTQKLGFLVPYDNSKPENGSFGIITVKNSEMTLHETEGVRIITAA